MLNQLLQPHEHARTVLQTPGITLDECADAAMVNIRGSAGDKRFLDGVASVLGFPLPLTPNRFVTSGGMQIVWLGPDEWLVIASHGVQKLLTDTLEAQLEGLHAAVTDVTGNRIGLRLSGPDARELLSVGCSIDLDPRSFLSGQCAQTLLARAAVTLLQIDDAPTFDILARRSFARYLRSWLIQAATSLTGHR